MLRKIRSLSIGKSPSPQDSRRDSVATTISTVHEEAIPATEGKLTFFDLPAEIRNAIYEEVVSSTVLTLPAYKQQKLIPRPNGLLLASKQCRKEYLPLLYSTAPIIAEVKDFDFANLMRVVGGLYSMELKAMRVNRNLIIHLRTQNCARENLATLRRWLVNRADSLDRLPWHYEVQVADPSNAMGRVRLLRESEYYAERLRRKHLNVTDSLQWELDAVIAAFERKAMDLDNSIVAGYPKTTRDFTRNVRGLSGGGLR